MGLHLLLLVTLAAILTLGHAVEDSDSTAPLHQKAWRETDDEIGIGTRDVDSEPSESQNTRSNYKDHPNNGPLLEEERPRQRSRSRTNGKRRRRMRKRPRTTTPEPYVEEIEQSQQPEARNTDEYVPNKPRFQTERIQDDIRDLPIEEQEEVKPQQRRRPGRRRRPHHRRPLKSEDHHEDYLPEKTHQESVRESNTDDRPINQGRKRRRGNGRKRIRVETEPTITVVETTSQPTTIETTSEDLATYEESHSKGFMGTKEQFETNTEPIEYTTLPDKSTNEYAQQLSTTEDHEENHTYKMIVESTTVLPQETEEPQKPQTSESHTEVHYSTTFSTRHTSDANVYTTKNDTTAELSNTSMANTESIQETTVQPTRPILSRFSSKHKLHSRISSDSFKIVTTTEIPTENNITKTKKIKPQHDEPEIKIDRKALFSSSSRKLPQTSAIIRRRLKQKHNNTTLQQDEEPIPTHLNTVKKYAPEHNEQIEPSTLLPNGFKTNPEILSPMKLLEEITLNEVLKMMTSTTEHTSDEVQTTIKTEDKPDTRRLNLDGIELPNIRDEILDLINSESGSSRLARILELRNMTLTELLDHRERGSSQLYFSENFNKHPTEKPNTSSSTTTSTTTTKKQEHTLITTEKPDTEPTTIIIPNTVKPFSPRTAKTTPALKRTTKPTTTTEIYENETTKFKAVETTFEVQSQEKPTMKIEASVMSVPIMEPTSTSNIQFPEQGVQSKFPKLLSDTLKHEVIKINQRSKPEDKMVGAASKTRLYAFITETDDDENDKRKPRLFDSMPEFSPNKTSVFKTSNKYNKTGFLNWKTQFQVDPVKPFKGEHKELMIAVTTGRSKQIDIDDVLLYNEKDDLPRNNAAGKIMADIESTKSREEDYSSEVRRFPPGVKSAILASGAILGLAILGFLTVLVSCRLRQKNTRIRGKRDILCERLQEDFRSSQCSLSPVLSKSHRTPVFGQGIHSNTTSNRHYYLWRTLRKTFQYE